MKISDCIEIIRAATEQLTITLIKKPKDKSADHKTEQPKAKTRPSRPTEAPEAEVISKGRTKFY